jgi:hypothetical protein
MRRLHGTVDYSTIATFQADLARPAFADEELVALAAMHRQRHQQLSLAGQPVNEHDKLMHLSRAIAGKPEFRMALDSFHVVNSNQALHTFEMLVLHLHTQSRATILGQTQYRANAVLPAAEPTLTQAVVSALIQEAVATALAAQAATFRHADRAPVSRAQGGTNGTPAKTTFYCYHHGYESSHQGAHCHSMKRATPAKRAARSHTDVPAGTPNGNAEKFVPRVWNN